MFKTYSTLHLQNSRMSPNLIQNCSDPKQEHAQRPEAYDEEIDLRTNMFRSVNRNRRNGIEEYLCHSPRLVIAGGVFDDERG